LARFIRKVKEVNAEKRVDIVAHSLGGVISRIALTDHRLSDSIRMLITLGSPHQGTYSARLLNTTTLRDLRPDSALMRNLRRKKWPPKTRGITLWSRSDLMVVPHESATLPGTTAIEMTPFTHYSYLIDPKCWKVVHEAVSAST
jgi:pimeloyl-ACP methyl ester carboxylesterase